MGKNVDLYRKSSAKSSQDELVLMAFWGRKIAGGLIQMQIEGKERRRTVINMAANRKTTLTGICWWKARHLRSQMRAVGDSRHVPANRRKYVEELRT